MRNDLSMTLTAMSSPDTHPFSSLEPNFILQAIESSGYACDGRVLTLNSYENRVYQVGIEDGDPLIAKFYRPNRWTTEQIQEEHDFCFELADAELPVVAPLRNADGETIFNFGEFRLSLFPRKGGRAPELDNQDNLYVLGRFLGRMHLIGASEPFKFRPSIDSKTYGHDSVTYISEYFIPAELKQAYQSLTKDLLQRIDSIIAEMDSVRVIRVHGDCHIGNMLWRDDAPHFIDFDDCRMAPAVQDIWMLLSGSRDEQRSQLIDILDGYNEFGEFNPNELSLIAVLRTLRMLHFSAWLARRWDDPAFPHGFPWFNTSQYWESHVLNLREQLFELQEPAIEIY